MGFGIPPPPFWATSLSTAEVGGIRKVLLATGFTEGVLTGDIGNYRETETRKSASRFPKRAFIASISATSSIRAVSVGLPSRPTLKFTFFSPRVARVSVLLHALPDSYGKELLL